MYRNARRGVHGFILQSVESDDFLWMGGVMYTDRENHAYKVLYIDSDTPLCFSESGHCGSSTNRNDILGQSVVSKIKKGESRQRLLLAP